MADTLTTTQLFSRRGIGYLWDHRNELDPGQVSLINSMYNNRKKGTLECQQTITYKLSGKKAGKLGWGRYYGTKGSLEQLEKECRGTLCADFYHDIDIVNCHFVILAQFARSKYQKDLPEVERYVTDRDSFFREIGGSRDDAKAEIIRILYGGLCKNEFLMPLSAETRAFSKFLSNQDEYKELFNACKSEDNIFGSFLSFILQTEERKCMMAMKTSLEILGWKVDVLAYDGVMIRKNDKLDLTAAMKACEEGILAATNYSVSIVHKEMSSFAMPELTEEIVKGVSREQYAEMKAKFEATNFYYAPSHEMVNVQGRTLMRMGIDHAREYYSRVWRFEHSQKFADFTSFFDLWRLDKTARSILKIDMRESDDPSVFVMSPKFAWKEEGPLAIEAVQKFKEIMSLIGNPAQQDYIIKWLAQLVQFPFERVGSSLVVTGEKRTGKDTPFDFFNEFVIGDDYSRNYTCGGAQFFDKHDMGRMNMFLCKVEESNRRVFLANADKFKTLITAKDEMFNDKGKRAITTANYNRFVLTTNGACPVEMSDGEQRFLIATCSSVRKHDIPYWTEVRKVLFNPAAGRAVGRWLADMDLSGFEFRKMPEDEFQATLVDAELTTEERFISQWDGAELSATDFFHAYRSFCSENELPYCQNVKSLGINLLKLIRDRKLIKKKKEDGSYYRKP
jgi:hypothetical protein